jgi:hypothetical protein
MISHNGEKISWPNLWDIRHVKQFTGEIWYVDGTNGHDTNFDGKKPSTAFKTIGAAIAAAAAGDGITVRAGTYNEDGLDMNLDGLELWCEIGATITNDAPGTCLTVSGASCLVRGLKVKQSGQIGIKITGADCLIEDTTAIDCTISFDIDGTYTIIRWCHSQEASVTAYDISSKECLLYLCNAMGEGNATRGFYLSDAGADRCTLYDCLSGGNGTAGFEIVAGCTYNFFGNCESGSGDGRPVDAGTDTHLDVKFIDSQEEHEIIYPFPDGEGTAGIPIAMESEVNDETGANSTKDYFGDPFALVPPATITAMWMFKGVNIFSTTAADDQRFTAYRVVHALSATRNGGNNWDEGATQLTVSSEAEAAQFQANDLVWISSPGYKPHGEIVKVASVSGAVITIARQTENSGRTGLHWDHTTNDGGNEVLYLCYRDEYKYHAHQFDFSASGVRDFARFVFSSPRRMMPNDGVVVRMINGTDDLNSQAALTAIRL